MQWRSALDAKGDVEAVITVGDVVAASRAARRRSGARSVLAVQSVRETVDLGFVSEEAVDAVHFALQEVGMQYDVEPRDSGCRRIGTERPRRRVRVAAAQIDGVR